MTNLSIDQIMAVDEARQAQDITALPEHLRAALADSRAARLQVAGRRAA